MSVSNKPTYLPCFKEVSDVCQEHFKGVLESYKCVSKKFQGCFKKVLRVFQGSFKECFKEVSKVFQGRFKGVSGKFQKCFKEVSRVFQGSFKGVSRKCQGCFMFQGGGSFKDVS